MTKKIIIIGNGASGNAAAEEILAQNDKHNITMITNEATPLYYRPMLSEYISEEDIPKRFYMHTFDWYKDNNINLMIDTKVNSITPDQQIVTLSNGELLHYDALIICTGSFNFIPPMPGADKKNVVSLKTLDDANQIKEMAQKAKKAVIFGGGLLGLELGWQLRKLDIEVTVLEMMDRLLPRQLDTEASELFEEKVAKTGIKVLKNVETKGILGDTYVSGIELVSGEVLDADLVLFSIGVRADVSLAQEAGINIDRGIIVDDFMRTNFDNIYAAGDCAQHNKVNYSIWPEAVAQGKIAGLNASDIQSVYEPVVPFNVYHGMNIKLFSLGDVGGNPTLHYDMHRVKIDEDFEKYFFVDNVITGGILFGNISKSTKLKKAIASKMSKEDFLKLI
ncbi:MAG: hypothetical protein CVU84_01355 [Firmicutes bacterium HGW-Firmicutes-1]|jgi:nitrite reductase (NADH) large subunit|nr:MAG: hypothetical protein CVU84_01355 [Firmicutes bacterium HGW-Firmicutes-1]